MKTREQPAETLEEIVFRNRNRSYGTYQLRKQYKKTVAIALIVTLFVSSAIITYPLVTAMYVKPRVKIDDEKIITVELDKPPDEKPDPPPPLPPNPEKLTKRVKFVAPEIVDTAVDNQFGKQVLLADNSNTDIPDDQSDILVEDNNPHIITQPDEQQVFTVVEENPVFPGGETALYRFLAEALHYPEEAKELGIEGRVFVNFLIEKDGTVSNVNILRGIGCGCDEEAIRVIKSMPKWTPGKQRGIPVRVSYNLPIKFTLQ